VRALSGVNSDFDAGRKCPGENLSVASRLRYLIACAKDCARSLRVRLRSLVVSRVGACRYTGLYGLDIGASRDWAELS